MGYNPNSIGRTMAGELFITDGNGEAHVSGTEHFNEYWIPFLEKKRALIRSMNPTMTVKEKYDIIYPEGFSLMPVQSKEYMQTAVNEFISIWCGCINRAGMEL